MLASTSATTRSPQHYRLIFTELKTAVNFAVAAALAAEILGSRHGLGFLIANSGNFLRIDDLYATVVIGRVLPRLRTDRPQGRVLAGPPISPLGRPPPCSPRPRARAPHDGHVEAALRLSGVLSPSFTRPGNSVAMMPSACDSTQLGSVGSRPVKSCASGALTNGSDAEPTIT